MSTVLQVIDNLLDVFQPRSDTDQISLFCDNKYHGSNKICIENMPYCGCACGEEVSKCPCLPRLEQTLSTYHANDFNIGALDTVSTLDDFHHLLLVHDDEFECVFNTLGGYCNSNDITRCKMYRRNFRARENANHTQKTYPAEMQILDKIHCYYRHTFDIGGRWTADEARLLESDHDQKVTNDEFEPKSRFINTKMQIMKQILSQKTKTIRNEGSRYNVSRLSNAADPFTLYGFGEDFKYAYDYEENFDGGEPEHLVNVTHAYHSLKEEMTNNPIAILTMSQFIGEYKKAMIHLHGHHAKRHGFRVDEDETKAKNYGAVTVEYVLSLMIYCNMDKLQYEFSKTYREHQRHRYFYHLGMNLKKVINWFGIPMHDKIIKSFYHGIDRKMTFPTFVGDHSMGVLINCPLSTSSSFAVAQHFARSDGLIFEFECDSTPSPKYFATKWLSIRFRL
eukprot:955914_1